MFKRYTYALNDQVNGVDPFGLEKITVTRMVETTGSRIKTEKSVTVEAGDLSQEEVEDLMSTLSDSFFIDQDGNDISIFQKM